MVILLHQKWCANFTCLFPSDGKVCYNCSIMDLHDRSIIASITDIRMTSELAILTLQRALNSEPKIQGELILHSVQ